MGSLVNIIHPHTYKIVENGEKLNLVIGGSCSEYKARDRKVINFIRRALESSEVFRYNSYDDLMNLTYQSMAIELDPNLNILEDQRIKSFSTLPNGFPRPGKRPEDLDYNLWKMIRRGVISHSNLKKKIEGHFPIVFFGGAFERCLGNAVVYCTDQYNIPGKNIFCVQDMCASFNEKEAEAMEQELLNRDVQIINYEEAIQLLE